MCGITAYWGPGMALEPLIAGLQRLEYRGYDSAGVAVVQQAEGAASQLAIVKAAGKVANLKSLCEGKDLAGHVGIAHTRWATHGPPNTKNAHPQVSKSGKIAVVHNGIVENFVALRQLLTSRGFVFVSDTDTEVLAHLVEMMFEDHGDITPSDAVHYALELVEGAFGCAFVFADFPNVLIGARHGSPLILGVSDAQCLLASDPSAVVEYTKDVVYLGEHEMVTIQPHADDPTKPAWTVTNLRDSSQECDPIIVKLDISLEAIEKGGYKHFMLKEIMEQPNVLRNCMRGRVDAAAGTVRLGGLEAHMDLLVKAKRILIVACGTSYHSGLVAEYLLESLARVKVEVEYASEFRYRDPILEEGDIVVAISQSGETADTLAAVNLANERGIPTVGIVNVVGSTISRQTTCGAYLHVGPEIGVASTKAFTAQVTVLTALAILLGQQRGHLSDEAAAELVRGLAALPDSVQHVLDHAATDIYTLSLSYRFAHSFLFLGRGFNFPVALEGALKLKEISYIHAEGYAAAEMKHGPIALIDKFMPVVVVAPTSDPVYEKVRSNVEEVLARGGNVIIITEEGNTDFDGKAEAIVRVPTVPVQLSPLLNVVPLQLLSYYIADLRKCEIDQPRNLAKSVVVE